MSSIKFISDRKYLILFYVVLMSFITSVLGFDNVTRISVNNILYINIVSTILFLLYLLISFWFNKNYYNSIFRLIDKYHKYIENRLPTPLNHEQALFNELILKLSNEYRKEIGQKQLEQHEHADFIASWVHEAKTPVSICRLIIENPLDNHILISLEEELNKIDSLLEQALYYSRIDDLSTDYLIVELNVESVINEIIKKNRKSFISKNIKVESLELNFIVNTDKKWFSFIIDQIVSNALKYTQKMGNIKIYKEILNNCVTLVVEDNGIGIKPEDVERVFKKGFTGYNGRQNLNATGFGLYLSDKLAAKLGHKLTIESEYGKYTRVRIYFPVINEYYKVF